VGLQQLDTPELQVRTYQYELWLRHELFTHLDVISRSYALEKGACIRTEFSRRHVKISQAAVGDAFGKPLPHRAPAGLRVSRGWLEFVCYATFLAPVAYHARTVRSQVCTAPFACGVLS
jgi:hypothetical protein